MTTVDDYEPTTAPPAEPAPLAAAPDVAAALALVKTWDKWAGDAAMPPDGGPWTPAFVRDVAGQLVAYLAVAATVIARPPDTLVPWLDDLGEPTEVLVDAGMYDAARWLDAQSQLPEPVHALVIDRARALVRFATVDPSATVPVDPSAPDFRYGNVAEWVNGYLLRVVRKAPSTRRAWCPRWWEHREAVERFNALWRAWETLRAQPGESWSTWWVSHFDAHWDSLTDPDLGPFAQCSDGTTPDEPANHSTLQQPYPVAAISAEELAALPSLEAHQP